MEIRKRPGIRQALQDCRPMVDGKVIEPNAEPAYRVFVKKGIVRDPDAKLTVGMPFTATSSFAGTVASSP